MGELHRIVATSTPSTCGSNPRKPRRPALEITKHNDKLRVGSNWVAKGFLPGCESIFETAGENWWMSLELVIFQHFSNEIYANYSHFLKILRSCARGSVSAQYSLKSDAAHTINLPQPNSERRIPHFERKCFTH